MKIIFAASHAMCASICVCVGGVAIWIAIDRGGDAALFLPLLMVASGVIALTSCIIDTWVKA